MTMLPWFLSRVIPARDVTRIIQPQVALEVRAGERVHQCQSCDRFLCFIPEPEPQTESAVPK